MQPFYNPQGNAAISMEPVPADLRYMFMVEFTDGTQYHQNEEDTSQFFEGKSAFYDVMHLTGSFNHVQDREVAWFYLTDKSNWYTVCMQDGHFEINGFSFEAHPRDLVLDKYRRLIFFREYEGSRRFFMGWEQENFSQTIAII